MKILQKDNMQLVLFSDTMMGDELEIRTKDVKK